MIIDNQTLRKKVSVEPHALNYVFLTDDIYYAHAENKMVATVIPFLAWKPNHGCDR